MNDKRNRKVNSLGKNESITRPVFISSMEEKRKDGGKGDPYVSFKFCDSITSVDANMFQFENNCVATIDALEKLGIKPESLVTVTLTKNAKGFVNVSGISTNVDPEVTLKDFAQVTEGSAEERYNNIIDILGKVSEERKYLMDCDNGTISDLAMVFYSQHKQELLWSAAAEMMHSENAGGLMEHTEAMVRNAIKLCEVYPDLDKELLVTAAALHDIGKLEELSTDMLGHASYTAKGIGLGHILLGTMYIDRIVQKEPERYPLERVFLLESTLASHHGKKEWGSPVEPITIEGFMLSFIDQMDAKYHEVKREINTLQPGMISISSRPLGIDHRVYRTMEEGDLNDNI